MSDEQPVPYRPGSVTSWVLSTIAITGWVPKECADVLDGPTIRQLLENGHAVLREMPEQGDMYVLTEAGRKAVSETS